AELTTTAAVVEGRRDPVAHAEALHVRAELDDLTAELVTEDRRQLEAQADPLPITLPAVPVASADAGRLDLEDGVVGTGGGIRHVIDDQWLVGFSDNSCTHCDTPITRDAHLCASGSEISAPMHMTIVTVPLHRRCT